ncbi:hypothetical protein [Halorussus salinisoli]|uniref:hypothetical protein n=1 Tax=Halorussus salinisoli TaxID=2558242 RepID=UPI0010C1BFA9|nr:hypothetical protein [Halorussus salinisoli]
MDRSGARRLFALLALGVLVFTSGCADFPPSPTVCITCEKGIENATADGPDVSVESSELGIRVREDGNSRWTVRANLSGPDVGELRSDPDRVSRLARESVTGAVGDVAPYVAIHGGNVTNLSARMEDDVLVVSFTVSNVARRGFGEVLLVDYFDTEGRGPSSYLLGADRVVVRGPAGTVATNYPPEANVTERGRAVVWRSSDTRVVTGDTYVAFAPDDRLSTRLATRSTVTSHVASWAAPRTARVGWLYALGLLGVTVLVSRSFAGKSPVRRVGRGDSLRARFADRPPVDLPAVVVLHAGLLVGIFGGVGRTLVGELFVWPLIVSVGGFLLLGVSIGRYPRASRFLAFSLGGVPFVVASALVTSSRPSSTPQLDLLVFVVVLLLLGTPSFVLGTRFRRRSDAESSSES